MIDASKKVTAADSAKFSVGPAVRSLAVCCLLTGVAGPALAAGAGQDGGQPSRATMRQQVQQVQDWQRGNANNGARLDQRQPDPQSFEARADSQRSSYSLRDQDQSQAEAARRNNNGRMSADERRDLRRQINEAGQDLYGRPPRR
jgi:hypothetical protein